MKHDAPYYIKQCMSNQNTIDAQNVILNLIIPLIFLNIHNLHIYHCLSVRDAISE